VSKCLKSHGDLKLAFVITKGQFELDVICAKELTPSSSKKPGMNEFLHSQTLAEYDQVVSNYANHHS